ncbi:uncharacterized protein LOC142355849 [Convolutriloba macropyga]|uniref:uncharacterized protein LOC142355849 n=1 Tax=Convolutriloba macropyga TaxID=536237 RepID=UPI003F527AB1
MLPRDTDWYTLAQCDFFAVEKFVQTADRIAMRTIEPIREAIFRRKTENDQKWINTYKEVCESYKKLEPNFAIRHDNYGGYRMLYTGSSVVSPCTVLRRNPIGFVREIPDGVVTELSVMSSERTGKQLILLGPMRFINSDCSPNCEYDFSSETGIVQLRVKKRINPGEEIFVKYGPDFFDKNSCLCRTCDLEAREKLHDDIFLDLLLNDVLDELSREVIKESQRSSEKKTDGGCSKRRRKRARELVEYFNNLADSPPSADESHEKFFDGSTHFNFSIPQKNSKVSKTHVPIQQKQILAIEDFEDLFSEDEQILPENVFEARASSPLSTSATLSFSLSAIGETSVADSPSLVDKDNNTQPSEKLYAESDVNVQDASNLTEVFCAKYNLSDDCSKSLYALVDVLLPEENKLPSGYSHIQEMKKNFDDRIRLLKKTSEYSLCVLNFRFQLRDIVKRNFSQIIEYAKLREKFPNSDFKHSLCPPVTKQLDNRLVFNLILFSDGVNIKKSTHKKEPWPVWVQLADLPPKIRMARNNIVLAALHVGATYPDWKQVVPLIQAEVISSIEIEVSDDLRYQSLFKFRLLIADLGAKNHMLNILKFNGYYGCHYCTVEGKTIGRTHAYYPHDVRGCLREPHLNDLYVSIAEAISITKNPNVVGVRGRSAFASLIEGLPLTAPN